MKNQIRGFSVQLLVGIFAVLIIGVSVYFYNDKKVTINTLGNTQLSSNSICGDFKDFSDYVLNNIQKPDSQKVMEMNPYVITSFHWKRSATEPYITYPIVRGVEAYYGDNETSRNIDFTVDAIKKSSESLAKSINDEVKKLGFSLNQLNTLNYQSFSNQDVIQTYAFEKGENLYSIVLTVDSGNHQASPYGVVRITCGKAIDNFDKVYNSLSLKADLSIPNPYYDDYVAIADVSTDNTVYAVLGSINQIRISNYYYFDGSKLKLVGKDSYPVECSSLESQKVGLGMKCSDKYNPRKVEYTN